MKIVIFDPKCPEPYDPEMLKKKGVGGTEATIIRVSEALSENDEVSVLQHNRKVVGMSKSGVRYLPVSYLESEASGADHFIFIQKAQHITRVAGVSNARMWLWFHNYASEAIPIHLWDHIRYRVGIICVSHAHSLDTKKHMRSKFLYWATAGFSGRAGVQYVYNPVDVNVSGLVNKDRNKLIFFSSPCRGIEKIIEVFDMAYRRFPDLRLYIANPGYFVMSTAYDHPGVRVLGSLPHEAIMKHVRESLCVFYPQTVKPETFGLIYAEANAVGAAVLAYDFGAAREVLHKNNPPIKSKDSAVFIDVLERWYKSGSPKVCLDERFSISSVVSEWNRILS